MDPRIGCNKEWLEELAAESQKEVDNLIALVREYAHQARERGREDIPATLSIKIEYIGRGVAALGGLEAMLRLHDKCEEQTGNTNEIGYWLNLQWDGIGGWWA